MKQEGFIPQTPTLHQIYLSQVFENYLNQIKLLFENKPVVIIINKITDDYSHSVVNILFYFQKNTKLVSVDFLIQVNNSTIRSTLLIILTKYNILLSFP